MALRGDSQVMDEREAMKARVQALAARAWDVPAIAVRYRKLLQDGIAPRRLDRVADSARTKR